MTRYRREINQCPKCDCEFITTVAMSISAFGENSYTDGYVGGSVIDMGGALLICPGCTMYLWKEDVLARRFVDDKASNELSLAWAEKLRGPDFEILLGQTYWNSEAQERYIRRRAWWSFNNVYREHPDKEFELPAEQEENLLRLLQLIDTNNSFNALTTAEIYRQLGQFEQCLKQLELVVNDDYLRPIDTIKKLAHCQKRQVGVVPPKPRIPGAIYGDLPVPYWARPQTERQHSGIKSRLKKVWEFLRNK